MRGKTSPRGVKQDSHTSLAYTVTLRPCLLCSEVEFFFFSYCAFAGGWFSGFWEVGFFSRSFKNNIGKPLSIDHNNKRHDSTHSWAEDILVSLLNLSLEEVRKKKKRNKKTKVKSSGKFSGITNTRASFQSKKMLCLNIPHSISPIKLTFSFFPLSCAVGPIPLISSHFLTTLSFC